MTNKPAGGIVIGRFMPPHSGHRYLIDFARNFAPDLTVFVCTLASEPIPGDLRVRWMRELFPTVRIVHITEEIPEASRGSDGAQDIWARSVLQHLAGPPDYVFASEEYGAELASSLNAKFVPVDPRRALFPVSAGMIRNDPFTYWEYIPRNVRPFFVRKVSVVSDDPRVIQHLADRFDTVFVADYASYLQKLSLGGPTIGLPEELQAAQTAAEGALLGRANRVVFLQTDLLQSILSAADPAQIERLASGDLDQALEEGKPHLVLLLGGSDSLYRAEAERRGWLVRELDGDTPDLEEAAASIVEDVLLRPAGSEEARGW